MPSKTTTKYNCAICKSFDENTSGSGPCQLSHIKNHCKSNHHKKNCEIFKLNLQMKTFDDILIDYPEYLDDADKFENKLYLIDTIIFDRSMVKNVSKKVEEETNECQKYKPSNKVVWELSKNTDENENYKQIKSNLESLIKQCHNVLYSSSIVGQKAQNDIMRLLCIKILQYQFNDETSELWDRCNTVKANRNISDNNFKKYKSFCTNLTELYKSNKGILTEWKGFVNKFLSGENGVFPSIYYEDDSKFNCIDESTLQKLIDKIESIKIDDEFVDSFSTTCGDIHESFRSYGGGKGAKELGQYFTPRQLIHLIFHGLNLNQYLDKIDNPSIYDPCMGTGGFLTRLFNLGNINPENIYGCETELDTIKFGEMSLFLTTKGNKQNIVKCNSLSENPFMIDKKVDAIVTNPPFDTKFNYESLEKTFDKNFSDSSVKFTDIYPFKTNNGACLFLQHCVYMLNDGGVCAIILPNGEIFNGQQLWTINFRKWMLDNINIIKIIECPSGTFKHAIVKTNIILFTKTGKTENINYMVTNKQTEYLEEKITISYEDILLTTNNTMDYRMYLGYTNNSNLDYISLKDICNFDSTKLASKKNKPGNYTFITAADENKTHNEYSHDCECILYVTGSSGSLGKVKYWKGGKFTPSSLLVVMTIKEDINISYDFLYLFLKNQRKLICEKYSTGSGKITINNNNLGKIMIPLLDNKTQENIIKEYYELEKNIEMKEKELHNLNEMKNNIISNI